MTVLREAPAHPTPSATGAIPSGFVRVPMEKNCILLLNEAEYIRGLRRGKVWKRRQVLRQRTENRR
jgi:hypothetical protein